MWRLSAAALIGVFIAITNVAILADEGDLEAVGGGAILLDIVVGLVCVVLVVWRRRHPLLVVSVLGLASAVSTFAGGPWALAAVSVGTRRRWTDLLVVAATSIAGTLVYNRLYPTDESAPLWFTPVFGLVLVIAVSAFGWYIGARRDLLASLRERAETAEREKTAFLASARSNERAAIAREMHDVLAHRISLVAMHAGALSFRPDLDAAQRAQIASTIEANAQLALADLRDVLGVLRNPDTSLGGPPDRPQPTLADVEALAQETVEAGTPVALTTQVQGQPPTTLGRHAYRIAQESLTNARKHAPGLPVQLTVSGRPGLGLRVETVNPLPLRPVPSITGAGVGLTGMAERAALAGGSLEHGATPDGRYRVVARFPWADPEHPAAPSTDGTTRGTPVDHLADKDPT